MKLLDIPQDSLDGGAANRLLCTGQGTTKQDKTEKPDIEPCPERISVISVEFKDGK
jgi:hypothetical protein